MHRAGVIKLIVLYHLGSGGLVVLPFFSLTHCRAEKMENDGDHDPLVSDLK